MTTRKNTRKSKAKRFCFALPARDAELLKLYADHHGITRPDAVRRILREQLKQYASNLPKPEPKNQLELFDTLQVDIFNNTSKT